MSNSVRHRERRIKRAKQKQYENNIKRNARNKNFVQERTPIGLQVTKRGRRSLWQHLREFYNRQVKERVKRVWR